MDINWLSNLTAESREIDDLDTAQIAAIEKSTQKIGRYLFDHLQDTNPSIFQRRWWDDQIMQWSMKDEVLKVQLFRFVDVLPMLHSADDVVGHLHEYLNEVRERLPAPLRVSLGLARRTSVVRAAVAKAARLSAMDFARRFIAGTTAKEVLSAAQQQRDQHRGFTLDILGEAVTSEKEAQQFFEAYVNLIEQTAPTVNAWPEVPQVDLGESGPLPRVNLSIKLSALDSQFDAIDPAGVTRRAGTRLRQLLRVARQQGAFINVDMESYDKKDLTLQIFKTILMEDEFRDFGDVGIVIQCYLRDALHDLRELRDWAATRETPIWVRLVKGAYWDYETVHARAHDWPIPVFQQKWHSDACFERATRFLLRNTEHLRPAIGSHNVRSIAHAIATAEHLKVPDNGYEIQMLYGMADAEKQALVDRGTRLRIYMPYGELIPGMAYLVRRLLENTSNDSFLRAGFMEHESAQLLLRAPAPTDAETPPATKKAMETKSAIAPFRNEPPIDFARAANRQAMEDALRSVREQLGKTTCPLVIGNQPVDVAARQNSIDPSLKSQVVATVCQADAQHVAKAVEAARQALPAWHQAGATGRAEIIRAAAQAMRDRFFELSAWEVYECGKGWREATNDVCEAIDFCEYYTAGAIDLEQPHGKMIPGEDNDFVYLPRGVTAVIAPWNFPLAILTGMTVAALATGNTVIMKPAEQSSRIGWELMRIFRDVGIPAGVLNYLPGPGETVGAAAVEHPDVAMIAFTGSRSVGLQINARAAQVSATNCQIVKRVIAEMGGKNAIIVDSDADLDEAVLGVVKSAFGFQGQKCSACSRVLVMDAVYNTFVDRLVEATRSLKVGPADDPETSVGPLIDEDSYRKVLKYVDLGRREGREALSVDVGELAAQGYFVGPHIFVDIAPDARLAQEEVFGPVLAVIRVKDIDHALQVANATDYALTGGLFSRSPEHLDRVRRELNVGNLYLNRNITGALVSRQPFGGFKMSGIGSKAGGPDYLLQFVVPKTITENTMRRGFAPPADDE